MPLSFSLLSSFRLSPSFLCTFIRENGHMKTSRSRRLSCTKNALACLNTVTYSSSGLPGGGAETSHLISKLDRFLAFVLHFCLPSPGLLLLLTVSTFSTFIYLPYLYLFSLPSFLYLYFATFISLPSLRYLHFSIFISLPSLSILSLPSFLPFISLSLFLFLCLSHSLSLSPPFSLYSCFTRCQVPQSATLPSSRCNMWMKPAAHDAPTRASWKNFP